MKRTSARFSFFFFSFRVSAAQFFLEISVRNRDNAILKIKTSLLQKVFFTPFLHH